MFTARPFLRVGAVALAVAAVGGVPKRASGYCRTRTCEFDQGASCEEDPLTGCSTQGAPASWSDSCVSFAVQRDGSVAQGIPAQTVVALMDAGFRAWSGVQCGTVVGQTPWLSAVSRGQSQCDAVEYNCRSDDNVNLVTFRDQQTFSLDRTTIALTTVIANLSTGEILDADIELNSFDHEFAVGAPPRRSNATDLRVVLNHEIGHFLGLSHSFDENALMHPLYGSEPLPQADDALGMCEAVGQALEDPSCAGIEPVASDHACVGAETVDCPARAGSGALGDQGGCQPCAVSGRPSGSAYGYGLGGAFAAVGLLLFRRNTGRVGARTRG